MFSQSSRITLRLALLLFIVLVTQSDEGRLLAQSNNPITRPLPFNKTVSGQLHGKSETVTYTFDIPIDQDVVIEYRANKLVFSGHCVFTGESLPDEEHCTHYGGSGGDRPITSVDLITTLGKTGQHVTVTLVRVLDGESTYQITAYTFAPQVINLGQSVNGTPADSSQHQIYTVEADPTVPFTVEVEDLEAKGDFLWAAYEPFTFASFPIVETQPLLLPHYIDGVRSSNGTTGINSLDVYYLGGRTFHILVRSPKSYKLYSTKADLPVLNENHPITTTVSYRQPLLVTQLNIQPGEQAQVNFNVTVGKGAIVRVFEVNSLSDEGLSLGWTGANGSTFELSGNVQRTVSKALYVVVQIPFNYTRDKVNIRVSWQRIN